MSTPALNELEDRLKANGVTASPRKIASAILGLARICGWNERPQEFVTWLEQLALDVVNIKQKPGVDETS